MRGGEEPAVRNEETPVPDDETRKDRHFEIPEVHELRPDEPPPGTPSPPSSEAHPDDDEPRPPAEMSATFQRRWERVQSVFVAAARRGPRELAGPRLSAR
jgi:hypothetical protein